MAIEHLGLQEIVIADIQIGHRTREIDESHVLDLMNIIQLHGFTVPILIGYKKSGEGSGKNLVPRLVCGSHRLEAMTRLKHKTIPAMVVKGSLQELRMLETEENILRKNYTALDRATALAQLKKDYEAVYPEAKNYVIGGKNRQDPTSEIISFAAYASKRIGLSKRSVQKDIDIFGKLSNPVRKRLSGTPLASKRSYLNLLADVGHETQQKAVDLYFEAIEDDKGKKKKTARKPSHYITYASTGNWPEQNTQSNDLIETSKKDFLAVWNKANDKGRIEIMKMQNAWLAEHNWTIRLSNTEGTGQQL